VNNFAGMNFESNLRSEHNDSGRKDPGRTRSLCPYPTRIEPRTPSRAAEICSNVAVTLAIVIIGGITACVWHPMAKHQLAHSVEEIEYMACVLNVVLPGALLALAASAAVKIWGKTFRPLSFLLVTTALLGVSACALAMYTSFVAAHPEVNLWSRIWWRLAS
jgi:hypothetical protein